MIEESCDAIEETAALRFRWWLSGRLATAASAWRASCDWLKWLGYKEGNIERHARHELTLTGWFDKDGMYGDMMGPAVLRLCREFADEGHSGMSAGLAINLFKEVSAFKPLAPLTGDDDEWNEVGDGVWQNRRCSHVFKENGLDGPKAYDSEGHIFREPDGCCYQSKDSRVYVTFPYTPKTKYVDAPVSGES